MKLLSFAFHFIKFRLPEVALKSVRDRINIMVDENKALHKQQESQTTIQMKHIAFNINNTGYGHIARLVEIKEDYPASSA